MKFEFLGTGAADFKIETDHDDLGFRRFSSMLVDDTFLIDPGPHIFDYVETFKKPDLFRNVKAVIVTHSHGDHLNAGTVARLAEIAPECVFAGGAASMNILNAAGVSVPFTALQPFTEYTFAGYTVTPLPANHDTGIPGETAFHYSIVTPEGKKFFYGADGAWFLAPTFNYMCVQNYDAMVLELTLGETAYDYRMFTHNSLSMLRVMLPILRAPRGKHYGTTKPGCKIYTTHMCKMVHTDQETLAATLAPLNVTPAYDGFVTEI